MACLLGGGGGSAYPGILLSCPEENPNNHKSGRDFHTDKPGCITSCRGYELTQHFHTLFLNFGTQFPLLQPALES